MFSVVGSSNRSALARRKMDQTLTLQIAIAVIDGRARLGLK
jgi:hypothetical protein